MLTIAGGIILTVVLIAVFHAVGVTSLIIIGVLAYLTADYAHLFWELTAWEMVAVMVLVVVVVGTIEDVLQRVLSPTGDRWRV